MSLAFALGLAAIVQNACRNPQAGSERAEALITLANEHGLPFWVALGSIARGRALVQGGRAHEGLEQLQQAMQERRTKDGLEGRPSFVIVAEAYAATGEAAAGLQMLAEAQAAQSDDERYLEAEVYRLKGEMLLAHGSRKHSKGGTKQKSKKLTPSSRIPDPFSEAEVCFMKALDVARQQHAKSLELRAATSLARWWKYQGKLREAYTLLSDVYHWFTEGFATKDLQEAKTLLEQWTASSITLRTGTSR